MFQIGDPEIFAIELNAKVLPDHKSYWGTVRFAIGGRWFGDLNHECWLNAELQNICAIPDGPFDARLTERLSQLSAESILATVSTIYYGEYPEATTLSDEDRMFLGEFKVGPLEAHFKGVRICVIPELEAFRIVATEIPNPLDEPMFFRNFSEARCEATEFVRVCKGIKDGVPTLPGGQSIFD